MKKILLFCLLIISANLSSQPPSTLAQFFDGNGNNQGYIPFPITISTDSANIWQIGKPRKAIFNSPASAPNVIITDTSHFYPINNVSTFSFVVGAFSDPVVRWKQKLDMDRKNDGGLVEFSTDNGATWQNAHNNPAVNQFYGFLPSNKDTINGNQYCFSGTDTTWRDIWLCLSSINISSSLIQLRFTFKSDSINNNKEGWMMDNFYVQHTFIMHPVKEISKVGNIVVYPNVTTGIVNVEMKKKNPTDQIQNIELFDNEGKLVESYGPNYNKVLLDISKYKGGIYYLRVTVDNKITKFKLIYEKT